jgi:signal transduction histidine kinase
MKLVVAVSGQLQRFSKPARRWLGKIALAAVVAVAYFVAARLSLGLLLEPDGVAVFWPAAGISSGLLIALGPHARWPVAVGVMAATIPANLMGDRNLAASIAFALCNAAEALITGELIHRSFGLSIHLGRLRMVLGLLAAAVVGTAISGIGGAVSYKLFHSPDVPMLTTWWHWFVSDVVGIIAVTPLFIGIATSIRRPPVRGQIPEALVVLGALTGMTLLITLMPPRVWQTVVPGALLVPFLLWLSARFRSVFSAIGGFMMSVTVVLATIYGIGHFGASDIPVEDRILQAQTFIVVMMLGALIGAALFAERRRAEASLVRANMALERERDNKLTNAEAITAAIAHEIRQPLSAIMLDGAAGLKLLEESPPDHQRAHESLKRMLAGVHRTNDVFDGIRNLFRRTDEALQSTDVNGIIRGVLGLLLGDLQDVGVAQRVQLAPDLPLVRCNRNQLHEVILNLVHNALEAMNGAPRRVLRVRTELHGPDAVLVTIEDTGHGIDADKLDKIFDAFFTTKKNGMGLGLAICRMIIEHHGGRLTASSDGQTGAVFTIELPVRPSGP